MPYWTYIVFSKIYNIDGIINEEIGLVFKEVLECAGVYKCTDEGRAAFQKFIDAVNL